MEMKKKKKKKKPRLGRYPMGPTTILVQFLPCAGQSSTQRVTLCSFSPCLWLLQNSPISSSLLHLCWKLQLPFSHQQYPWFQCLQKLSTCSDDSCSCLYLPLSLLSHLADLDPAPHLNLDLDLAWPSTSCLLFPPSLWLSSDLGQFLLQNIMAKGFLCWQKWFPWE